MGKVLSGLKPEKTLYLSCAAAAIFNCLCVSGADAQQGCNMVTVSYGTNSISSTEISTQQALEMIERQRSRQSTLTFVSAPSFQTVEDAVRAPNSTVLARKQSEKKLKTPVQRFLARRRAKQKSGAASLRSQQGYSYKASGSNAVFSSDNGVWAEIYGDYERHTSLNPGQLDNPTRSQATGGIISGIDRTFKIIDFFGPATIQLGVLGGYNHTHSTFSNTPDFVNSNQTDEGGFAGIYGSYFLDRVAIDLLIKGDFYSHQQSAQTPPNCQGDNNVLGNGEVSEKSLTAASDASYLFDLGNAVLAGPVVGYRYAYTSFGDGALALGLKDGQVWRFQGGAKIATGGIYGGYSWTASLLGLLYDDVSIRGFTTNLVQENFPPAVPQASVVDQGKVRVLGLFLGTVSGGDGLVYTLQLEVRGGENVIGAGGKVGLRYLW